MLRLRSHAFKASRRLNSTSSTIQYYKTPTIPSLEPTESSKENGIAGLFSNKGLDNAWFKRAELYCDGLNKEVARQGLAAHDVNVLVDEYARSPSKSDLFNNASLLHNTEFAMSCLGRVREESQIPSKAKNDDLFRTPNLSHDVPNQPVDEAFQKWIKDSFGSLIEFKTLLLNSANSINGDGFTWLVARKPKKKYVIDGSKANDEYDNLFVLNTYNAGNPNNAKRFGQLNEITKKLKTLTEGDANSDNESLSISASSILSLIDAKNTTFGDIEYKPILAIDASPKAYLYDYGVFGKKTYLEQVWKALDWDVITRRVPARTEDFTIRGRAIPY